MSQIRETEETSNSREPVSIEIPAYNKIVKNEQLNNEQLPTYNQVTYNPNLTTTPIIIQPIPNQLTLNFNQQPSDYLVWSIFNSLLCCWCLGFGALVFSVITYDRIKRKKYSDAFDSSRISFFLNLSSTIFGILLFIYIVVFYNVNY